MIRHVYTLLLNRGIHAHVPYPANTAIEIANAIRGAGFYAETLGGRVGITSVFEVPMDEDRVLEIRKGVGSMVVDHDGIVFSGFRPGRKPETVSKVIDTVINTLKERCSTTV